MAYNALNNLIDAYIYANGVQAITGQILNGVLKQMVSQLGSGYHLMGVAGPETVPASNDYAMAYFAATAGEYTDFGGITLAAGEVAVLLTSGNGSWSKQTIYNVPTGTADLENTANFITNAVTDLVNYYTKEEIDTTLADYPTLEALATALADYYTKTEIDEQKAETDAALADRYTKSETDAKLADYYKKTETYDKDEVDSIIAALSRQEYIVAWDGLAAPDVSAIPAGVTVTYSGATYTGTLAASASTVNKIYMVWNGTAYDMYGTSADGGYSWVPMGTTTVDLSQYATRAELNQLEAKVDDISTGKYYGYYATAADLPDDATVDGFAYVGSGPTYTIYNCEGGVWTSTDITVNQSPIGNDEDIDQNEDGKLQFANRVYNAQQSNGMGYVILRRNKTFAEQVTEANTIYEIRYEFILEEDITIPENCILEFRGGSIRGNNNITIDFNNAKIVANSKVFHSIVPLQDSEFWSEINPIWFGIVDDGVTDNIGALNALNLFASKIKYTKVSFRSFANSYPIIRFETSGHVKITEPWVIDYPCNIIGYPKIYYAGASVDKSGAVIIHNQYQSTFELNVTSRISDEETNDFSDGKIFAGICIKTAWECNITAKDITGFLTAVLIYADGSSCFNCGKLSLQMVNGCPYCIYAYCINYGWPNALEICNINIENDSGKYTLPNDFTNGALIKISGDGLSNINSWDIHNCFLEGKIKNNFNYYLLDVSGLASISNIVFRSCRQENAGGLKLDVNEYNDICIYPGLSGEKNGTVTFPSKHNLRFPISDGASALGIKISPQFASRGIKYSYTNIKNVRNNGFYMLPEYMPNRLINANGWQVGKLFKLQPNKTIYGSVYNNKKGRASMLLTDDEHLPNKTFIDWGTNVEKISGSFAKVTDACEQYRSNEQLIVHNFALYNNSANDYYIFISGQYLDYLEVFGDVSEYIYSNDDAQVGSNRPSGLNANNAGFQYFDTSLSKPIYWSGTAWIDATGATV